MSQSLGRKQVTFLIMMLNVPASLSIPRCKNTDLFFFKKCLGHRTGVEVQLEWAVGVFAGSFASHSYDKWHQAGGEWMSEFWKANQAPSMCWETVSQENTGCWASSPWRDGKL